MKKYKFGKIIKWIVINGLFGFVAFFGACLNHEFAMNVTLFTVWALAIIYTLLMLSETAREHARNKGRDVPRWLSITYDICIALLFAGAGYFITAGVWVWLTICESVLYDFQEDKPKEVNIG